jgi:hypothetical protein
MSGWGDLFKDKYEEVLDESTGEMIMVLGPIRRLAFLPWPPASFKALGGGAAAALRPKPPCPAAGGEGHQEVQAGLSGQHHQS